MNRRNLTAGQKAAIAVEFLPELAKEAKARQRAGQERGRAVQHGEVVPGPGSQNQPSGHRAREDAGALVGVSGASVA